MSNDYTLPPLPDGISWEGYRKYGHECAEHVRAPLVARIAELERSLEESESCLDNAVAKAPEPLRSLGEYLGRLLDDDDWPEAERYINAAALSCDRLRAELEALTAANAALLADAERYTHLKSIAKIGINKRQDFVITLDLVPCPGHIGMLDLALDADRNYNNKEPTPE